MQLTLLVLKYMGQCQLVKPSHGQTHAMLIYYGGSYDYQHLQYRRKHRN